jgi:hypothetical protein
LPLPFSLSYLRVTLSQRILYFCALLLLYHSEFLTHTHTHTHTT